MRRKKWLVGTMILIMAIVVGMVARSEADASLKSADLPNHEGEVDRIVQRAEGLGLELLDATVETVELDGHEFVNYRLVASVADRREEVQVTIGMFRELALAKAAGEISAPYANVVTVGFGVGENPHGIEIPPVEMHRWETGILDSDDVRESVLHIADRLASTFGLRSGGCELREDALGLRLEFHLTVDDDSRGNEVKAFTESLLGQVLQLNEEGAAIGYAVFMIDDLSGRALVTEVRDFATGLWMIGCEMDGYLDE